MRENFFLPATLIVCAIIFFCWQEFFYEPTQREILSTQLETRRLREVQRELVELKARHENFAAFVAAKEFELDAARNFLPTTLEHEKFIDELYRAAEIFDVQLTTVHAGDEISAEDIQAQVVTVKLEASYIALLNFIREIFDGGRLVSLENFSLEISSDDLLLCELSLKIFAASSINAKSPPNPNQP